MNTFAKAVVFAVLLLVIPMRHFGQTVKNSIIEIELATISNPDYRYCLLSTIAHDDNISYLINEEEGSVLLSSTANLDDQQFQAYYDGMRAMVDDDFHAYSSADKETQGATFTFWKERLPQDLFVLLFKQLLIENPPHRDGNQTCATADPFCTTDVVSFYIDASVSGSCESGPDYGCMTPYTARPPYWFYMKIGVAGTFTIQITNSNNNDLDFCAWGPFSDPTTPCTSQLTSDKIIDCDSPYNSVQECTIPANSQVGQYYLLVITRYSSGSTTVTFSKVAGSGPGETDCGILPPLVNNEGPYCVGDVIHLTANGQAGASYSWTGPNGFSSVQQNPTINNCTMAMAGIYTCTISLGSATNSAETEVVIYPQPTANFNFTTVCQGEATQFTSTSTTNPTGQQISDYQWNFGDGQTSNHQNPSHQYANAGSYQVTLTVSCGNGLCTSTKTQTVTVYAQPAANAGPDQTIAYGSTAQLSGSGGAGTFNFHWEPANMVSNPNAQNTQTVTLTQDQTYTLTVTNPQGQCTSSDEVTIHINGSAMTVNATASPSSICQGGSTQLAANAGGGTGNFTYSWTPTTGLSNPNIYNPIASPSETTTYTCHVSDGQTSQNVSVTVTVNDVIVENESMTICPDDIYHWHGAAYTEVGTYQFDTVTDQGCEKTIYLHLDHYPSYDETIIEEAICFGETYTFYGNTYDYSIQTSYTDHTIHGCDSIVRLNLTVWPENQIEEISIPLCPDQLPYYYEEDPNQIPLYEGLHIFHPEDEHGCERTVHVDIQVSDYYVPPMKLEHVCELPYIWEIRDVDNSLLETITIDSADFYIDTVQTAACQGIFQLDLRYLPAPEIIVEDTTVCDRYIWQVTGLPYSQTDTYHHSVSLAPFPCDQEYQLNLIVNKSDLNGERFYNGDEEGTPCDSIQFEWFGNTTYFKENGDYLFSSNNTNADIFNPNAITEHGCDTATLVRVTNMKYTPSPFKIQPTDNSTTWSDIPDPNVFDTAYVVTNTEFFSFQYEFYVNEAGNSVWDTCIWSISKPSWQIDPRFSADHKSSYCTVYVADRDEDFVVLTATAKNSCNENGKTKRFYLKSSFLDVDENELVPVNVDIVPNPNNGQMHLNFENMQGRTAVKVFDMTGNQIDAFETTITSNRHNYDYSLKKYADGIYFFVISNNNRVLTKKVIIIQ